jgi:glycosyltransferase involved in cell wall biosynthesis
VAFTPAIVEEPAVDPAVSVVIATEGRAEKLRRSLAGFECLHPETPAFEIIVVLDGTDQATRAVAREPRPFPVRFLEQPHRGTGPAKNLGAAHAHAPLVVFLNDDTRPDAGCLLAHVRAQARYGPCVVLGRVEWDPLLEVTPYMAWLAPNGHQFNFSRLRPHEAVHWDACWGAHLGLPRDWCLGEPFDDAFPYPSLEDTEWGFRVSHTGRPIRYEPEAVCFHDHRYAGPAGYRRRARISGAAARYTVRHHPAMLWPLVLRPAGAAAASTLLALCPGRWRRDTLWDLDFRWNLVWGMLTHHSRN